MLNGEEQRERRDRSREGQCGERDRSREEQRKRRGLSRKEREEARRSRRDEATLYAMTHIYCAGNCESTEAARGRRGLCPDCASCIEYAIERTRRCPHEHKGNCEDCDIHCYATEQRARIRAIMAYAGPRMLTKHPVMALRYLKKKLARGKSEQGR